MRGDYEHRERLQQLNDPAWREPCAHTAQNFYVYDLEDRSCLDCCRTLPDLEYGQDPDEVNICWKCGGPDGV